MMAGLGVVVLLATGYSLGRLGAGRTATLTGLGTIALAPLLLGHVFLNRYDLWPTALVALAVAGYLSHRDAAASGFLAGSFAAKTFALSMLPVAAERILLTRGRRGLVRSAAVFAVSYAWRSSPTSSRPRSADWDSATGPRPRGTCTEKACLARSSSPSTPWASTQPRSFPAIPGHSTSPGGFPRCSRR